jgi:hypothetical protein
MNLIDPFEFRDMFCYARSFAVVGNAPTIVENEYGDIIDSHDVIVRFNRATTTGLETKIGSRTDILVVNASNSLKLGAAPSAVAKPRCLVCFVSPHGLKDLDASPFREWVGSIPILITCGPDLIGIDASHHTRPLTSGTYALFTLVRLFCVEKLLVTGFTMFGAVAGGAQKYYPDDRPSVGTFHDLDQESILFARILEKYTGELVVTREIDDLAQRAGITLRGKELRGSTSVAQKCAQIRQRIADGLAWRFLRAGMILRRIAES